MLQIVYSNTETHSKYTKHIKIYTNAISNVRISESLEIYYIVTASKPVRCLREIRYFHILIQVESRALNKENYADAQSEIVLRKIHTKRHFCYPQFENRGLKKGSQIYKKP